MRKVLVWFRSRPWFTAFVSFIFCGIALHFFLDWRVERQWERYVAEARSRGVKLTAVELEQPPVPDAENFAHIPLLKAAFAGGGARPFALPRNAGNRIPFGNILRGERVDWKAWQNNFLQAGYISELTSDPVRDTLHALDHYAPQFQQWSEWRSRPQSRFALDLKRGPMMPLAHLGTFQDAVKVFGLRMRAHLAMGESGAAYDDFQDGFQAYRALREEPTLIDGLVRVSVLLVLLNAVGDGLMDQAWSEQDLRKIEADLAGVRVWEDYRRAMEGEHAFTNTIAELLTRAQASGRSQVAANVYGTPAGFPTATSLWFQLMPRRVLRENQLRQNLYFDELLARVDPTGRHYDLDLATPSAPKNDRGFIEDFYYLPSKVFTSPFETVDRNYGFLKARLDEARLACALERFGMARGAFPAALAELTPEFVDDPPSDMYARAPYRYQRLDRGSFRLHSVGPDRRDDGGVLDPSKPEKKQSDDLWLHAPPLTPP
jgi:hypothetical protein